MPPLQPPSHSRALTIGRQSPACYLVPRLLTGQVITGKVTLAGWQICKAAIEGDCRPLGKADAQLSSTGQSVLTSIMVARKYPPGL